MADSPEKMSLKSVQTHTDSRDGSGFQVRLDRARQGDLQSLGQLLQWYTSYLTVLATTHIDNRIRRRVSPSDVVQEVLLAAHRDFADFRGVSQGELFTWIRRILINTLHRSIETHIKAGKRDVRREVSIDTISQSLDHSAAKLLALLHDNTSTAHEKLTAQEDALALANELNQLRPQYRDVIIYRILQGLSFDEIAELMNKSTAAVRMLWLRALDAFKIQRDIQREL